MQEPWLGFGSDGIAVNPGMKFMGHPHPRFYGTFPRILGVYVREQKVISLPEAVRKMTSLPAQITGLTDRGLLRPGMAADITYLRPANGQRRGHLREPSSVSHRNRVRACQRDRGDRSGETHRRATWACIVRSQQKRRRSYSSSHGKLKPTNVSARWAGRKVPITCRVVDTDTGPKRASGK